MGLVRRITVSVINTEIEIKKENKINKPAGGKIMAKRGWMMGGYGLKGGASNCFWRVYGLYMFYLYNIYIFYIYFKLFFIYFIIFNKKKGIKGILDLYLLALLALLTLLNPFKKYTSKTNI